jgi:hypothetical protein
MCIIQQISRGVQGGTAYVTCNYAKTLFVLLNIVLLKMNTTLFQIYLKCIWPKRQECDRKHTFFNS